MKMFEPQDGIPWIGLTLAEEKILAQALLQYTSENNLSPQHDTILLSRVDTGVIRAEDFVALMESFSHTMEGIPEIEWDDKCAEDDLEEPKLIIERLWIWKSVWENWTKDRLVEFPGNARLYKLDAQKFSDHEIERATEKEMIYWDLLIQNTEKMPNLSDQDLEDLTKDQAPRGKDVIASCLNGEWAALETAIVEEITS